jgi:HAMP domain-containing protein
MLTRFLRASLPAILAGTFGLQLAHADIYTWVDASGTINVSNLTPPEGVRVTNTLRASAPATPTRDDAARNAARQAEVQALAERVRRLEDEVELATRQAPPPVDYRAIPAPPVVQYVVTPPPVQYAFNVVNMTPPAPAYNGCDPTWINCGPWWFPGIYPASVVVVRGPNFRRFPPVHGGHQFAVQQPVRPPGAFRRG